MSTSITITTEEQLLLHLHRNLPTLHKLALECFRTTGNAQLSFTLWNEVLNFLAAIGLGLNRFREKEQQVFPLPVTESIDQTPLDRR